MPDTTARSQEIRAELNEMAPEPYLGDPGSAAALARYLAMEAQLIWTRLTVPSAAAGPDDSRLLGAYFAAARALAAFAEADPVTANGCAARIVEGWDGGLDLGEWVAAYLGEDADAIGKLAQELAEGKPADTRVLVDPADLRAALTATGVLPDDVYDRLVAAAGIAP